MTSGDERAFYRAELREISAMAERAMANTTDRTTRVHLEGIRDHVSKILDPNQPVASNTRANALAMEMLELYYNPTSCWPDYNIEP